MQQPTPKLREASRPVDFVKQVGRGKTLSQDLDSEAGLKAFSLLLDGAFAPAQFGAFLQALRIKELTQEELDALASVFRARMPALAPLRGARTLVLNLASDTGRKGGLASLLAAARLRRFGVGVGMVRSAPVLSGNAASFDRTLELARRSAPGFGVPVPPVLPAPAGTADTAGAAGANGAAGATVPDSLVADCAGLVRGLGAMAGLRGELGFRSCLHTAEKLVNPWPASPMLLGISHKHYALRMASTMASLGLEGRILLGNHGTVDLVLHKETEMVAVRGGDIREESVSPAVLGLALSPDVYSLGKFGEWDGWLADPESPGGAALEQAILYHLAVFLWASGAAPDPEAGLRAARGAA